MNTQVKITLVQVQKGITNRLVANPMQIDSVKIDEISGTIASQILEVHANIKRLGGKIQGFTFARKFDIELTINELDTVNLGSVYGTLASIVDARLTLQYNKKSYTKFVENVKTMIFSVMTGSTQNVLDTSEVKDELTLLFPEQKVIESELVEA